MVCGNGISIGFDLSVNILKKLKLIGEPFAIHHNTAFIQNMFNSSLEVKKFLNAKIQTVSGIRGVIKNTTRQGREGSFRAKFEAQLVRSDIVFCKTWYPIRMIKFYNPILFFDKIILA